eukprot:TRINITY_DN192_c0_g1_i4.p1 TRINITY_DN192_c0_g1~~TRINITY_DN192_c0_g1_i4.p1  ORF type:complete len:207 (-),score=51.73 TRINITY_DN192_c0_g1_i4:67-687(-)
MMIAENEARVSFMPFFFFKQKTAYEIGVRLVGSEMCIRDRHGDICLHTFNLKRQSFRRTLITFHFVKHNRFKKMRLGQKILGFLGVFALVALWAFFVYAVVDSSRPDSLKSTDLDGNLRGSVAARDAVPLEGAGPHIPEKPKEEPKSVHDNVQLKKKKGKKEETSQEDGTQSRRKRKQKKTVKSRKLSRKAKRSAHRDQRLSLIHI